MPDVKLARVSYANSQCELRDGEIYSFHINLDLGLQRVCNVDHGDLLNTYIIVSSQDEHVDIHTQFGLKQQYLVNGHDSFSKLNYIKAHPLRLRNLSCSEKIKVNQ